MNAENISVFLKGFGFIVGAILVQLGGSLAQWANSGTWPDKINWTVILVAAGAQGCNAMVTFASGAWASYRQQVRNGNDKTNPPTNP
jgi:hypothetical protein